MIKDKLTEEQVLALGPAVDLVTAGRAFGMGRTKSYELARTGKFPCPVLPLGHRFMVTKANLIKALDIKAPGDSPAPVAAAPPTAA